MFILALIEIFFLSIGFYVVIMMIMGFFSRNNRIEIIDKNPKFGVLIAARNEESVIKETVLQLKKQNYNKDMFEVIVIPNNCTDQTELYAKEAGAKIIKCDIKTKTKGEVLKHIFEKLNKKNKFDAYVIFDADNHVDENFLKEIAVSYRQGYRIARGKLEAKNAHSNWISGSYTLFFYLHNFIFNIPRQNLNMSATINGTGWMVTKELLQEVGFDCTTLTEDMEFSAICVLNGDKIGYRDQAVTYDEHPINFETSWKQRKRWSKGTIQCFNKYKYRLLKNMFINKSLSSFDIFLYFIGPILQVVSLFLLIRIPALFFIYNTQFLISFIIIKLIISGFSLFIGILFCLLVIFFNRKNIDKLMLVAIVFPVFVLTWIPINIAALFTKNIEWKAIKHGI